MNKSAKTQQSYSLFRFNYQTIYRKAWCCTLSMILSLIKIIWCKHNNINPNNSQTIWENGRKLLT